MAAAELKLQVGLDLAFFRQQLAQLGNVAVGYHMPINIKFSPIVIQQELSRLKKNIGKTQYTINIKTNLESEIKNADRLVKALQRVQRESGSGRSGLPVDIRQLRKTKSQGGFSAADIKTLFNAAIEGGLLDDKTLGKTREQMVTAFASIGKDSIEGLLNGLSSAEASIRTAAESIGATLITTTKTSLGMRSPSKKFEEIGKNVGKGFENGVLSSMDAAFNALERKMQQRMAVLDTIARGVFHMLGMDPAAMMAAERQKRLPPAQGQLPPAYRGIGPSAEPAGLLPRTTRAGAMGDTMRMLSQGAGEESPGVLAKTTKARIDEIISKYLRMVEVQVGKSFDIPFEFKKQLNTFSYLVQSLRDAETRTRQMQLPTTMAIGGTAFGSQKLLPTALGDETIKILRDAAHAFLNVMRQEMRAVVYQVGVQDLGNTIGRQAMLPGRTQAPLMLPAAGGTTPRSQMPLHAVSTGAYVGQPPFMQAPSMPPSMAPPLSGQSTRLASPLGAGYFEVGKGLNAIKTAYDQTKTFLNSPKFPVTGAIAGLGGEFGNAVKQVLLFGTAYKALAFLTSLPGEAFEAAKALATYKNQLQAVTAQSQTFDKSLAFVDNLAARFNVPLDSARQGFVKLYASMEPAGFKQGQIENLFTGISKAAAAFGLSSDKVDRVNYAFAQMASKGQIMSEELKGQLGDVLPGALGLFAEAAQMTIPEFSKAMEDGAFKGKAMEQVLDNVSILLNNKFSKAASGAAKTLQGAVNQIQNNLKLMYESFTPIVNGAAAAFGPQVNGLIKDITATMKVLTGTFVGAGNGFDTLSPRAQAFYTAIKTLEPSLRQAGAAIVDVGGKLAQLIPALAQVLAATISFAASPLGRAALLATVAIGTLTASLAILEATGIKAAIKSVYKFVGSLYAIPAATGVARIAIIGLKLAITGLFIGAILIGLDYVIGKMLGIGDAAQQSIWDIKQLASELDGLASSQDFIGLATKNKQAQNEVIIAERLLELYQKIDKAGVFDSLTEQQRAFLVEYGTKDPFENRIDFANKKLKDAMTKRGMTQKSLDNAQRLQDDEKARRAKELTKLSEVDLNEDGAKKQNLESYYSLLDDLAKATTQAEVDRAEAAFNHKRDLINAEYDYREARANSFQSKAIAFQKEIFNIVSKQEEEAFKSQNKIKLAAGSVSGLSPAGGGPTGLTSYITGDPSQKGKGYQPDHGTVKQYHDHLAFATRELAIQAYNKLTAADIKVTEFKGYGKGVTGPHSGAGSLHHQGLAMDVPGYQWGGTGAIGAKEYAGSARVRQVMGLEGQASAEAPRKVPGSEKREEISQRKTNLLTNEERAAAIERETKATEELKIATARYTASLLPTAEQGLQNQLLEQKINLTRAGASPSILEAQLTYARQELETNENIRINTLEIERLTAAGGKNSKAINVLRTANAELKASLPVSQVQLLTKSILEQADAIISKAVAAKKARSDENRLNQLIIGGLTQEQAEAKLAAEALEKDYAAAVKVINDKIKEYSGTLEKLNLRKAAGIALDKGQIEEYNRLQQAIADLEKEKAKAKGKKDEAASTPLPKEKTFKEGIAAELKTVTEQLAEMTKPANMVIGLARKIGSSFSEAFAKVLDGTASAQEALGGFFKNIGDYLIEYGTQMMALVIIKGILGLFGNGAAFDGGGITENAKGNAFTGSGIAKFATGGIVNGPTLFPFADGGAMQMGLMGEAGPEAIMPLQRGADGSLGVRAAMGGNGMGGSSSPVLNMNFETSTINGVEYVSRDQLELAMAQTRRQASSDGAKRGMTMTLDKIQQSPQTRRRIGM